MKLFGQCLWHSWDYKSIYYDCSDICIWSNGTEYYRQCKHCGETQKRKYYEDCYTKTTDINIIKLFKKDENIKRKSD